MTSAVIGVGLVGFTALTGLFCILYALRSNWQATRPGRALMYLNLTLAAMGVNAIAGHVFERYAAYDEIRAVLLLVMFGVLFQQLRVLREAQEQH